MKNKTLTFALFCIVLGLLSLVFVSMFSGGNNFYIGAYRPVVEKSEQQQSSVNRIKDGDDPRAYSNQPRATGLREDEIKKERGPGYATY